MLLKSFLTFIYIGTALFLNMMFGGNASVDLEVPGEVDAGQTFEVKLTVNKEDLSGFARLQQKLPHGLKAKKGLTSNSEFTFKDHKIKFLWFNLPVEEQVTLSYLLEVDERVMGNLNMGGTFSFISDNQRKSVNIPSKNIYINPSPNVKYSVDINEFKEDFNYNDQPVSDLIACIRQKPYLDKTTNEYTVNLLVYKKDKEKFAKIEENLPLGVKAYAEESKNPIFTFKNSKAKYIWMDLPESPYFVVTYKLTPGETSVNNINISGQFSYIEDETTTRIVEIIQRDDIDLSNTDINYLKSIIESSSELIAKANRYSEAGTTKIEEPKPDITEDPEKKTKPSGGGDIISPILNPIEGIYYKVQIAAGHKPVNIKKYFQKYHLKHEVTSENHEGWIKYSIGAFPTYKIARDYRVFIWNTTEIDDAFVAAYNSGKRITVQEALMIANHEWVK